MFSFPYFMGRMEEAYEWEEFDKEQLGIMMGYRRISALEGEY